VTHVHQDGVLDVGLCRNAAGRTVLSSLRHRFPLRMTVPLYLDAEDPAMAFLYVQNPTGAVLAHDRLSTAVSAGPGSRVHVTTQSATKIHRMADGEGVSDVAFTLAPDSYVEQVPDPLIPQAGSRYRQRTVVDMDASACFIGCETVAPGRRLRGERFAYDGLSLHTEVRVGGQPVCIDRLELRPNADVPASAGGMLLDRHYLVSMLVVAPERDAVSLEAKLDAAIAQEPGVVGGAGALPDGVGVLARVLATDGLQAQASLHRIWAQARLTLLGLPLPSVRK